MDDDLEEMQRLRRSRGYAEHQHQNPSSSSPAVTSSKPPLGESAWSASLHEHFGLDRKPSPSKFSFQRPGAPPSRPEKPLERVNGGGSDDDDAFGPSLPPATAATGPTPSQLAESDVVARFHLPITHDAVLKGHSRTVSALALEKSGARLISGGYDYQLRMWDFHGMDKHMKAFRQLEPDEGHQIVDVSCSVPSPDRILIVSSSAQALIYDRDGRKLCQFVRGDMYIRDMTHTKGHVTGLVGGQWHPTDTNVVMTASSDGTVRLWDVNRSSQCREVLKAKGVRGRTCVSAATMGHDGRLVVAAYTDGSLQSFSSNGRNFRPRAQVKTAHEPGSETSRVAVSDDDHTLLSRGGDDTLKVWDLRKFTEPLKTFSELPNFFSQTDAIFSPDNELIVAAVSAKRNAEEKGQLVFIERSSLQELQRVAVADASVVRIAWNDRINQIVTGCADNHIHMLYDPTLSTKGALHCVGKKPKRKDPSDFFQHLDIHAPHTLPMFKKDVSRKRQRDRDRNDPIKAKIPELPVSGHGKGGMVGSSFSKYMLKSIVRDESRGRELDPREAILAYADQAKKEPIFFGKAYEETQPEPKFHDKTEDQEEAEARAGTDSSEAAVNASDTHS